MDSQDHQSSSTSAHVDPNSQDQQSSPPPTVVKRKEQHNNKGRIVAIALSVGAVVSLLAIGILPRINQQQELNAAVKAQSVVPSVNVITAHRAVKSDLVLPGTVVSLNQTTVYARSTGYLRRWLVDIGQPVRAGQLLAEIESPDADQQVLQARADFAQAQANLVQSRANLAKGYSDLNQARANLFIGLKSWERWRFLVKQGAVAQEDADTRYATYKANLASVQSAENTVRVDQANVSATQATVNSNRANLQRYAVLQSFEKVTAPFTGIITARNVNAGVLITAGAGSGSNNTSLYTIAGYDDVDVNVYVPQSLAQSLQDGQPAKITVRELPQRIFTGKVVRTTNALDPNTRTLLTQVAVKNLDGALRPGMYATAKFNIARANPPFIVPDSALVINAAGTQVATVTSNNTVHYQKVVLGRDFGTEVEVTDGLTGHESLIATPTVDEREGTHIRPTQQKPG